MVSRQTTDRQTLDLQNAESATAWILSFVAKCPAEKKGDKSNTDGTVQDLQVANLFLSMCGQDAIVKLRSVISPRILIDTPYKDIRLATQNYISPKKKVVTAERAKFLSVIQGVGESVFFPDGHQKIWGNGTFFICTISREVCPREFCLVL